MSIEKVYKVVKVIDGEYYSSVSPRRFRLKYEIGKETISDPNTVGIFCYKDIYDATNYAKHVNRSRKMEIFEARGNGLIKAKSICCKSFDGDEILDFYENNLQVFTSTKPGIDTIFYKSIIPIKLIEI